MKKTIMALLVALFTPIMLQAGGIGIYVPYSLGIEKDGEVDSDYYYSDDYNYDYDLKNKSGIGMVVGTNLGARDVFSYKFALEYTQPQRKHTDIDSDKIEMLHTFEFGIIRTKVVKFWAGPRINIAYEGYDTTDYERDGIEIGIAPAIGLHLNINRAFALTFDVDYKLAWQGGDYDSNYDSGTYSESVTGPTARFGVFFKFGEAYGSYDVDKTCNE